MQCGHVATGKGNDESPVCKICDRLTPKARLIDENVNLDNRYAACFQCGQKIVNSSLSLPQFEYHPDKEYDLYYCGCREEE